MFTESIFVKDNCVSCDVIMKLGEYLSFNVPADKECIIEFYNVRYKRGIDIYVLGYFLNENIFDLFSPMDAFLLEYDKTSKKFINASKEEKNFFADESCFNFRWFCYD